MRRAFATGDPALAATVLGTLEQRVPETTSGMLDPYRLALEAIRGGRNAVLRRLSPEMRDAVELLLGAYDAAGRPQLNAAGQPE